MIVWSGSLVKSVVVCLVSFFVVYFSPTKGYDKVSAIVEVSLPLAAYFDIPQNGAKTDFFKQNH